MKKATIALMALACALLAPGCALTEDMVDLEYKPAASAARVPAADGVVVKVAAADARESNRDRISVKKNGYGMEMAAIRANQDIPLLVQDAIERELADRGFSKGDGPVFVLVDIHRFYADYKVGFWAADNVADVQLNVQVRGADGKLAYGKGINGEGRVEGVMLMGGDAVKAASDIALAETVRKLVTDEYFIQALVDTQRASAMTAAPAAPAAVIPASAKAPTS